MRRVVVFAVRALIQTAAALGLVAAPLAASAQAALPNRPSPPVNGLIVKLKNAPSHERMTALGADSLRNSESLRLSHVLQAARMTEARTKPVGRAAQHIDFGRVLTVAEAETLATQLRSQPDVEWVDLNRRERLLQTASNIPNDLYYPYVSPTDTGQWWLHPYGGATGPLPASWGVAGVETAWLTEKGKASAVVAVLDSGITNHTELAGRTLPGYDFVSDLAYSNDGGGRDSDPTDPGDWVTQADLANAAFAGCEAQNSSWHGTIVTGIIAAATNNTAGVAGVNWNGRVLPVRVAGKCGAEVTDIVDGMRWAAGLAVTGAPTNPNPARIINISFGGDAACGTAYQDTIDELTSLGVVVVAAAGNESGNPTRPASCNSVVGVGALARDGLKASYSNFGPKVVVSTVGGDPNADDGLLTLYNTGTTGPADQSYANVFGTSFAAPLVSGVISLMRSANPNLTVAQIISGLQITARPHVQSTSVPVCSSANPQVCVCTTNTCGAGILDADQAVKYALNAGQVVQPPASSDGGGALSWAWLIGLAMGVIGAAKASRPRAGT